MQAKVEKDRLAEAVLANFRENGWDDTFLAKHGMVGWVNSLSRTQLRHVRLRQMDAHRAANTLTGQLIYSLAELNMGHDKKRAERRAKLLKQMDGRIRRFYKVAKGFRV